ncbi:MAG: hypothetical protein FWG87_09195 [Defluviitaleaceae bacterium]|nr:hypothetical protein [Defluviitaleaceae bacterium]
MSDISVMGTASCFLCSICHKGGLYVYENLAMQMFNGFFVGDGFIRPEVCTLVNSAGNVH